MFKKNIIIIVAGLIVAFILGFLVYYFLFSTANPEVVVENFYNQWISYPKNNSGANPVADKAYNNRDDITDSLSKELDFLIDSFGERPGYDPILCAQDVPQSVEFKKASISGDYSEVIVFEDFWGHERRIKVVLQLEDKKWKINEIICLENSDEIDPIGQISNPASLYCQE